MDFSLTKDDSSVFYDLILSFSLRIYSRPRSNFDFNETLEVRDNFQLYVLSIYYSIYGGNTLCPRSSDPLYIVIYYMKWVTILLGHTVYNNNLGRHTLFESWYKVFFVLLHLYKLLRYWQSRQCNKSLRQNNMLILPNKHRFGLKNVSKDTLRQPNPNWLIILIEQSHLTHHSQQITINNSQ